jgi:chromosome partitioning protein
MAIGGLAAVLRTMERVRERLNPELSLVGIVPCRVDLRTNLSRAIVQRLRDSLPRWSFESILRENVRLAEAPMVAIHSANKRLCSMILNIECR